jgi:hypothetical protein
MTTIAKSQKSTKIEGRKFRKFNIAAGQTKEEGKGLN